MTRRAHTHIEHHTLATYDDVHRAFRHISEVKVLAILALRPTVDELDAVAQRLDKSKRLKRNRVRSEVPDAIMGVLAGTDLS